MGIISSLLGVIALLIIFYFLVFKRNPSIHIDEGIISPTHGKIVNITKSTKKAEIPKGMLGKVHTLTKDVAKECYIISIMMTPLDVHFQYAPIKGKVTSIQYQKGTFTNAVSANTLAILKNENNQILIEGKTKAKVIQIAGVLARRIHCYVKKNIHIHKGDKIGFIDIGSQVTLIIPTTHKLQVHIGQKVRGGDQIATQREIKIV
jgi:phosphatidylserine decarboxylase